MRLRIDRFALTSNNITYGAFGEGMSYWSFFPTGDAGTGCIPVWGFATVSESRTRAWRWASASTATTRSPTRSCCIRWPSMRIASSTARRIGASCTASTTSTCAAAATRSIGPSDEDVLALYRPLFTTSFLIDDFLADNGFFGAGEVLVSSASSKTAYGLGFCLAARRAAGGGVPSIGLTSPANLAFTAGLGCYDDVVAYADVTRLSPEVAAVYVDMSGDAALRATIHGHWQDRLAYSCSVGGTHWEGLGSGKGLPGPRPVLFFAPAQGKKRVSRLGAPGLPGSPRRVPGRPF